MNVGKVFAVLPIAIFWVFFAFFAVILSKIVPSQNNLTTFLLVSLLALFFVLVLTGTVLLIRHVKNESGFWTSKTNITLEQVASPKEGKMMQLIQTINVN